MAFFSSNFMLLTPNDQNHHQFHAPILGKRSMSFSGMEVCQEEEENLSDDGSQLAGEKKRRLNMEQVKTLERNFEVGNKLDHERKMQISRALGLQPRQVAIWFQNRRARWRTKQLQTDYDLLKKQLDLLKSDNQSLLALNQKLQCEVSALKGGGEPRELINLNKETDQGCSSNTTENSSDFKLDISTRTPKTTPIQNNGTSFSAQQQQNFGQVTQVFQNPQTSRFDLPVKEESFNNMFCAVDGFWPWIDQQNFN
ncbi:hypothetical protein V2J09_019984 [Rumex salicifolius]